MPSHFSLLSPKNQPIFLFILCALCASVVISACAPTPTPAPQVTPSATPALPPTFVLPTLRVFPTITPGFLPTRTPVTPSPTPPPTATATRDPALAPKNWREWPVIPAITGRGLEIYQRGLALGNDAHAFSKIADCQGIREVFLGVYDLAGSYKLSPENAALQDTITWFAGSFNRNGMAALGGFNARAVLQPQFADPTQCAAGESPIECEYRLHRPSIAVISLEFGYDGRTTQNYEAYLRQVIEFYINKGVLPILSTKADNAEGDQSINSTNAALAAEYDLPLWNWWRAAQDLPNLGMDITRPDGFHISVDAWQVRSATALQALDAVWRGAGGSLAAAALAVTPAPSATPRPTPTLTGTPAATSTPPPSPTLVASLPAAASSGHALVNLVRRVAGGDYEYLGIYALDPNAAGGLPGSPASPLQLLLGPGWRLQAAAPDGKSILAALGSDLYRIYLDGSRPNEYVTDGFLAGGRQGAAWAPDDRSLLFLGEIDGVRSVYLFMPGAQSGTLRRLEEGATPLELYPSPDLERVYFLSGSCTPAPGRPPSPLNCLPDRTWTVPYATPLLTDLPGVTRPAFSADGVSMAYTFRSEKDTTVLAVTTLERARIWSPLPETTYAVDYAWSPSGKWLAALALERSDYSGKPGALRVFLLNPTTLQKVEFPVMSGVAARLAWSADGRHLLVSSADPLAGSPPGNAINKGFRFSLRLFDVQSGQVDNLDGRIELTGTDFVFASSMVWIP